MQSKRSLNLQGAFFKGGEGGGGGWGDGEGVNAKKTMAVNKVSDVLARL